MKSRASFFIALRYLLGRAHEGGRYLRGAAAGIAVSLVPIIVTLIVADGMIRGILNRYLELGTGHIQVFSHIGGAEALDEIVETVRGIDGVRGAWLETRGMGVLVGAGGRAGTTVRAIDPAFWQDEGSLRYLEVLEGTARLYSSDGMLLGGTLAGSIGARAGDTVRLMTLLATPTGMILPRVTAFEVAGVVSAGYHELDALWSIVTEEGGRRILGAEFGGSSLLVKIDDPYGGASAMAGEVRAALGPGFGVHTWRDLLRSQYHSYESTRQLLMFIMALIVIVAAVNVSSATSMLALERRRDIAVLKVAGARPSGVAGVFLWGGFLTGVSGAILGISLGLAIGASINGLIRALEAALTFFSGLFGGGEVRILDPDFYLETIPIIIDWPTVALIGCFTIACSVAASWIPAWRAGRLKPMSLLRKY